MAPVGSCERFAVYIWRAEHGYQIFHPGDTEEREQPASRMVAASNGEDWSTDG